MPHRLAVHEKLHEILVDDVLGLGVEILLVEGDVNARVAQVMARIDPRKKVRTTR